MGSQTPTDLNAYAAEFQEAQRAKDQADANLSDALNKFNEKREELGLKPVDASGNEVKPKKTKESKDDKSDSSEGDSQKDQKPEKISPVGIKKSELLKIAKDEGVKGFDESSKVKDIAKAINKKRGVK